MKGVSKQPLTSTNHASSFFFTKKAAEQRSMISDSFDLCQIVDSRSSKCIPAARQGLDTGHFAAVGKTVTSGQKRSVMRRGEVQEVPE
jgi:hypothetical protein